MNKKYTFIEFIAACESDDFENINNRWVDWAKEFTSHLNSDINNIHYGECTNHTVSCYLCTIETLLKDYKEYYFNEDEWRTKNL
jgi:hypothetical protein